MSQMAGGGSHGLELLQRVLFTLGPSELVACLFVAVPVHVIVTGVLEAAEKVWTRMWA